MINILIKIHASTLRLDFILIKIHLSGGHAGATTSPAEDSEADGGTPVVPGPAQPCPPCQGPRDLRRHLLLIHSVEMHLISIKVLIEMYFILIVPRLKLSSPSQQIPSQRES